MARKKASAKSKAKETPAKPKTTAVKTKMTKTAILNELSEKTDLSRKQVTAVLEELEILIERHIKKTRRRRVHSARFTQNSIGKTPGDEKTPGSQSGHRRRNHDRPKAGLDSSTGYRTQTTQGNGWLASACQERVNKGRSRPFSLLLCYRLFFLSSTLLRRIQACVKVNS